MAVSFQVTFDCADPDRLAHFWAIALDYQMQPPPTGYDSWEAFLQAQNVPREVWDSMSAVTDPAGVGPRLLFQRVPEGKTVKNRVHLDVNIGGDLQTPPQVREERVAAHAARLIEAGATQVAEMRQQGGYWRIMTDLEGNEFCLQ